jgi:hypothetical protein
LAWSFHVLKHRIAIWFPLGKLFQRHSRLIWSKSQLIIRMADLELLKQAVATATSRSTIQRNSLPNKPIATAERLPGFAFDGKIFINSSVR